MAALMSLTQISNGNPAYETFYRQVDPGNLGKVGAAEAAQFLKRSGLSDSTLGKIWDLSDPEGKGYLDKRGFFVALRLVASAQNGGDVSQASLNQTLSIPAPKFRDTGSPSLILTSSGDSTWTVKFEEKAKYDGIFESLLPINGLLSGDKVKPVLINSNLPLDVLGKIWDLSDIDKDGHLDKEEFAVAMHLVYRAREKETVPSILPPSLIPQSKWKKSAVALAGSVPVLPSSPFLLKENLRPTTPLSKSPLTIASNLSPSNSFRSLSPSPSPSPAPQQPVSTNWVVPQDDREQYEEIFELADSDFDSMVGGGEVKDIFINSGLPQSVLAHIWSLADTKSVGLLTKEQFCLAMHLIQQAVKGVEPPKSLNPDMIPPSERVSAASTEVINTVVPVELTGNKELDDVSQKVAQLQSEKRSIEQEIRQKEETLRQKNSEIHGMQVDLEQENSSIKELERQTLGAQNRLQDMEQQRSKLECKVTEAKTKVLEENNKISSMQAQIISQEATQQTQEKELNRTKTDLYCLEQEETQLEEKLCAGKAKLESILKLLKTSQNEMDEVREKISQIQESQKQLNKTVERYDKVLNGSTCNLAEIEQLLAEEGSGLRSTVEDSSFKSRLAMFNNNAAQTFSVDPFQTEDPFKSDPFNKADPFGGDPFKQSDPFGDPFSRSEGFTSSPTSPLNASSFGRQGNPTSVGSPKFKGSDPFAPTESFSESFGGNGGFADFGNMSKVSSGPRTGRKPTYPLPPPKKTVPARPAPPPYGTCSAGTHTGVGAHRQTHGVPRFAGPCEDSRSSPQPSRSTLTDSLTLADLRAFGNEVEQLEWAKRESKKEEERLKKLRLQEQQDLELALALSRVDMSRT
ncbi:epidermal growth factor receptor substrate 15-like 1 isoform X1 [Silurus asotus]|uniref:Epidermal growth factor receptor substrate 15-like 1 isoform X1 n=1 Tax=Silurus asotus TaxID=30991 RepID=A0AAD5FNG3_SILAS|nr:epidermal growth factor receptor substrate 15-like 1 isoform X1 [Silurus asotus]